MSQATFPLTGQQYDIAAGDYQATITELGAGLRSLSLSGRPVIAGYDRDQVPPAAPASCCSPGRTGSTTAGTPSAAAPTSSTCPSPRTITPSTG